MCRSESSPSLTRRRLKKGSFLAASYSCDGWIGRACSRGLCVEEREREKKKISKKEEEERRDRKKVLSSSSDFDLLLYYQTEVKGSLPVMCSLQSSFVSRTVACRAKERKVGMGTD